MYKFSGLTFGKNGEAEKMALQRCIRTYSTDSMGSAAVFTEESYYHGMLKSTEGKKGSTKICRMYFSVSPG